MNGNLAQKGSHGLTYDPLNRLIKAESDSELLTFSYDPLGRRLSKNSDETEFYLYDGVNEVASLRSNGALKDVCIPGYRNPIAIELGGKVFIPISDCRGNVRRLIDPNTQIFQSYDYTAFGEEKGPVQAPSNPWRYAGKRFDAELGLSYFGHRYYDANLGRWISTDPVGFIDGTNLYAYVLNNPLGFFDPDGRSIGGFVLGLGEIVLGGTLMITGGILEVASFGAYTIGFGFQEAAGLALISHGLLLTSTNAQDLSFNRYSTYSWKNANVYVPDRPLPNSPDGIHVPDVDAPHTQLGTKEGRHGKYPQVREFDEKGNPVRDIDFTDHGRPQNHPNQHQHEHKPNPTGGTLTRDPIGKPVSGWSYE